MTATLMDGKALALRIRAEVAKEVRDFGAVGLATVLVGDDPASQIYIRLKQEAATEAGITPRDIRMPETTTEAELLAKVAELNTDDSIQALLVQLPVPKGIDDGRVIRAIAPDKDVDGIHPANLGELLLGQPRLVPATARGVMALLAEYDVELDGAQAVVIGRSEIVGKPVAQLLEHANATVTICHSHTRDLARHTREADILVAAVGRAALVMPEMVKPGAAVIDVGMNRTESGLVGDVDPDAREVAGLITPVPGGVGPMTIACLLENAVACARLQQR